jgi:uncharacterized repeat protein (TIGR04076 family)
MGKGSREDRHSQRRFTVTDENAEKTEKRWRKYQERFGFTEEELAAFRSRPQHIKSMERAPAFATHNIVIEIIEAHHCAADYKAGDRFVVNGEGMLILDQCPPKLCAAAIAGFKLLIDRMWQAFYDGSTEVLHDTARCPDVGVKNGGWGEIVMRVHAVPKK